MKIINIMRVGIVLAFVGFGCNNVKSKENASIENAKTTKEVIDIGNKLVPSLEASVEKEFKRINDKYRGSKEMQLMLKLTKDTWNNSNNIQCRMEQLATDGGKLQGDNSVNGEKAFLKCYIRKYTDMKNELSKL